MSDHGFAAAIARLVQAEDRWQAARTALVDCPLNADPYEVRRRVLEAEDASKERDAAKAAARELLTEVGF